MHLLKYLLAKLLVGSALAGIARGVDTRCAIEEVYLKSAVVCDGRELCCLENSARLYVRVLLEGIAVLYDLVCEACLPH